MPTYEYICKACTHEFEVFHSIKADPISICPKCKKKKVTRKLGIGGAVIFKGGGFYETDYRSESYKQGETAANKPVEEKSTTPPEAAADASSSAKPADAKTSSASTNKEAPAATPTKPQVESKPTPTPESAPQKESQGDSRATHPSRAGRGRGNIVQSAAKANAKKPSRAKKSR